MISGVPAVPLLIAGLLLCIIAGSLGILLGRAAHRRHFRFSMINKDRVLANMQSELEHTCQLLTRKTHDLHVLQAASRTEIDKLRLTLKSVAAESRQARSHAESKPGPDGSTERRDTAQGTQPVKPDENLLKVLAERQREQDTGHTPENIPVDDELATAFLEMENTDSVESTRVNPDPEPDTVASQVQRKQHQMIEQLLQKNRQLRSQLAGVDNVGATDPAPVAPDPESVTLQNERIQCLEHELHQAGERYARLQQELDTLEQTTDGQQKIISKLELQLQQQQKRVESGESQYSELNTAHEKQKQLSARLTVRVASLRRELDEQAERVQQQAGECTGSGTSTRTKSAGCADDLKMIFGVGPKLEKLLNRQGITTFEQIAQLNRQQVRHLAQQLGAFGSRIERDNWVQSARKLVRQKPGRAA